MAERAKVIKIDSSIDWDRRLHFTEKHSGWQVFKFLYWGIYLLVIGAILIIAGYTGLTSSLFRAGQ